MTNQTNQAYYPTKDKGSPKCGFTSKRKYANEKEARDALHLQQQYGASVRRYYHCPHCKGYHLTAERVQTNTKGNRVRKPYKRVKRNWLFYDGEEC